VGARQRLVVKHDRDDRHGFREGIDGARDATPQPRLRNIGAKDGDGTVPVADQHGQDLLGVWHEKTSVVRRLHQNRRVPKRSGQRDAASENAKSERETTNIVHVRVKMG
jgi:hypothetical protein